MLGRVPELFVRRCLLSFTTQSTLPRTIPCIRSTSIRSMANEDTSHYLNADRLQRVSIATADQEWTPSPSATVWRRRVFLEGPKEAGRVTSVVRYDKNSVFHEHGHPDGEEIFVLEGAWQDANGDHPAGTFMLNPEGFKHAPSSKDGCVLLVRLRQFGGKREHVRIATTELPWAATDDAGVSEKLLYSESPTYKESIRLERWNAGNTISRSLDQQTELYLLTGSVKDPESGKVHGKGTWFRFPAKDQWTLEALEPTEFHVKTGYWPDDMA